MWIFLRLYNAIVYILGIVGCVLIKAGAFHIGAVQAVVETKEFFLI
jgi:hypothetical protein